MRAPVWTSTPSRRSTSVMRTPDCGSSTASSRSAASTIDTAVPNRANTWPSSTPMAPPPSTTSDDGAVSASMASRLVQYRPSRSASPGIGGAHALAPAATTTARRAW